jgi:nitrite reductase/ring-hydroxylating ferredoxin subunit
MTERVRTESDAGPDVIEEVDRLISVLQSHPDAAVVEQVSALLAGIDAIHRTALTHLIGAIRAMAGDAFVNRLVADPAIRLLFMSYDLVAVDRRLMAEEALDPARGPLHAAGIDVELTEVVGGVVYVRLHRRHADGPPDAEAFAALEGSLREHFVGFQQLVSDDEQTRTGRAPVISIDSLRTLNRPVYRAALDAAAVPVGDVRAVDVEGQPVLLANVGGDLYAVRNRCGSSPLPLQFGSLTGPELRCSWHGCRYDVRTGKRLDADGERLPVYPITVRDGVVHVALTVEPAVRSRS